jgi:hypothetical protein
MLTNPKESFPVYVQVAPTRLLVQVGEELMTLPPIR